MVFNHVYNINVPLESLCSVDLDSAVPPPSQATRGAVSSGGGEGATEFREQTVDADSQVTFTHRINIPKQACACSTANIVQQLAIRIEMLEREVLLLRAQCSSGSCGCGESSAMGKCGIIVQFDSIIRATVPWS